MIDELIVLLKKAIVVGLILFISPSIAAYGIYKHKVKQEWRNKVNTCIMEPTSRKDCKLIIYRDKQLHGQNTDDNLLMYSAGMAVGMSLRGK